MGERKGTNKYYPPDYDPSKGSLNSWLGTHALRDRARKLHKGILIIRFEMPYNIWCDGCNNHIGMGVRYNAEKSKVGNYYTTPIYKFRMKCHLCNNHFEIQTDPKNHDYVILEGARRKEQRWDPHANEQIVPEDKATQKKLATDPMYKLEHGSDDKQKGKQGQLSVAQIEDMRESWNDDYMLNKLARSKFRGEKQQIAATKAADQALLDKSSLDIVLVPETDEDKKAAGLVKYSVTKTFDKKQQEKRKAIGNRPLFIPAATAVTPTKAKEGSVSRRTEIKHKLGLHLSSPRVEHFIGQPSSSASSSSTLKGLKKSIRKSNQSSASVDSVSSVTEADSSKTVSSEREHKHESQLSENVDVLPPQNQETHCLSAETEHDNMNSSTESQDQNVRGLEKPVNEKRHAQELVDCEDKKTAGESSHTLKSSVDNGTGLATLIASYSDSESGGSDIADQS